MSLSARCYSLKASISDKDFSKRNCVCSDELRGNKNHMRKTTKNEERNDRAFKMTEHATKTGIKALAAEQWI